MEFLIFYYGIYTILLGLFSHFYYFLKKKQLTNEQKLRLLITPQFIWAEKEGEKGANQVALMSYYWVCNLIFFCIILLFQLVPLVLLPYQETPPDNPTSEDIVEGIGYAAVSTGYLFEIFLVNVGFWIVILFVSLILPILIVLYKWIFAPQNH